MFVVIVIVIILGFLAYSLLWPDPEKQDFNDQRHVLVYLVKIVYRSLRFTQGVLKLGNELVYRAGAGAGQSALRIIPTNHKVVLTGIRVDKSHLHQYKELCGYDPADSHVPICYPETLFMKQLLALVTSKKFCLSPIGLIHLRQTIKQHEPLKDYVNTDLTGTAAVTEYRETNRGVEVDISLSLADPSYICIWEGCVTLLSRSKSLRSRETRRFGEGAEEVHYRDLPREVNVPEDTGLRYAKITGDWNPHHLFKYTAWLLGYKAPIAHGMWTLSRVLAVRELFDIFVKDVNGRYYIDCHFKRPVFMPGTMIVKTCNSYDVCQVKIEDKASSVPHLLAKIVKLHQQRLTRDFSFRKHKT